MGNALPSEVLRLVELCELAAVGDVEARRLAKELEDALSVLSKFDEGPDLVLYYKELMVLEGYLEFTHQINSSDRLSESQRQYLHGQWQQFKTWWDKWDGNPKNMKEKTEET